MSVRLTGVWQPGSGTEAWYAGLSFDEFDQKVKELLGKGMRLVAADMNGGRYAGVWHSGTGAEYWYSGRVDGAAIKDKEYFAKGFRLVSISVHEGGVLCVWRPGSGAQLWNVGMTVDEFKEKDAAHFKNGLRLVAVDELDGRFAAVWQEGSGAQWWTWGSVDEIAAADKVHFAAGLHMRTIGGHQGRMVAVWRPQPGPQIWKATADFESFKKTDTDVLAKGLRMSAIRIHADPSAKNPQMAAWGVVGSQEIANTEWTEECQGLTCDGSSWLIVSNNSDFRGVHRLSLDLGTHQGKRAFPGPGTHVGAPSFDMKSGLLYVPVEGPVSVWVLNKQLQTIGLTAGPAISEAQDGHMSWCAISPWNGWLYSSTFDDVDRVHAYDPTKAFAHVATVVLGGPRLFGVQGGCISNNGHLYLTSDKSGLVHGYDIISGQSLGVAPVPYSPGGVDGEELEGIAIAHLIHNNKTHSWVHVMVLDNDVTNRDDVFMKHFAVPYPELL